MSRSASGVGAVLVAALRQPAADLTSGEVLELVAGVDEDALLTAAWHHRAICTLYLQTRHVDGVFAAVTRAVLTQAYLQQQIRHMQVTADLGVLARAFDEAGVRWATFKGLVLAETAYRRPDQRMYTDLDVMVHPADLARAVSVLSRNGADRVGASWQELQDREVAQVSLRLRHGTLLDLHWHLFSLPWARAAFDVDLQRLLERRRRVRVAGLDVSTLSIEDTLLHLAAHACLSGAYRLLWLKDVDQAARVPGLDWDVVRTRSEQWGTRLLTGALLQRTNRILGTPVPRALLAPRGGETLWHRLLVDLDRLHPLEHSLTRYTWQSLWRATRNDTSASARQFASSAWLRLTRRQEVDTEVHSVSELGRPDPATDAEELAAYLPDILATARVPQHGRTRGRSRHDG